MASPVVSLTCTFGTMWSNCLNNDFDLMNLITLKQKNNNQTNQENKAKIVVQINAE